MKTRAASTFSRRTLFSIAGTGAIVASVAALWRRRSPDAEAAPLRPAGVIPYADYDGWMVTPAEKTRLVAAAAAPAPPASR